MTDTEHAVAATRTHLAKTWLVRMVLITVVLFAFGGWAFYDATVKYPSRGERYAEAVQLEYLKAARSGGRLFDASVFDPAGELAKLEAREVTELSNFDHAKREWLQALAVPGLGMLTAEHTQMADPAAELDRLETLFQSQTPPAPLSKHDIAVQWGLCAICWAIGLYMVGLFVMVRSRAYRWDPATNTLTLPGGRSLGPSDLDAADPVDLSKWHKFIVFLRPAEGASIKLDVFRHEPLEDWVRVLVKSVDGEFEFPDEVKAREAAEAEAAAAAAAAAEDEGVAQGEAEPADGDR
jgi:hypothetical protein